MNKKKLLILGAGPTSSLIVYNIKTCSKLKDIFDIDVWEKSRGFGGRFSTSRSATNYKCFADLGAQYLTWNGNAFSKPYFENLLDHKLITEFETSNIPGFRHDPTKSNYLCSQGTGSIVKHFFRQAGSESISISFNKQVVGIKPNENSIEVETKKGESESFDFVVSTIPIPQLLQFKNADNFISVNSNIKQELEKVQYTTRFALGLFYDDMRGPFSDISSIRPVNFVSDDAVIRYWSVENLKRGNVSEPCSIVVHTSVSFGAENREKMPDSVKEFLTKKATDLIGDLRSTEPNFVKCHKWKFSQVERAYINQPGFVQISKKLIASGDSFTQSGIEGCIKSSLKTVQHLESIV